MEVDVDCWCNCSLWFVIIVKVVVKISEEVLVDWVIIEVFLGVEIMCKLGVIVWEEFEMFILFMKIYFVVCFNKKDKKNRRGK